MTRAEQVPRGEDAAGTQRPERLTYGSLFTGIGGIDLGFDRCGMKCRWQVEIDDYATRVLEKHWPDVPRWRDVNDFIADANSQRSIEGDCAKRTGGTVQGRNGEDQETLCEREKCQPRPDQVGDVFGVDVVAGGFPCQPVSVAGNRKGDRDERWLWDQFREVVELLRPRVVLAENVPGLLSADAGRLFGNVLGDLAALGFDAEWGCIPASAFDFPHQRFRVFVIAYRTGKRLEGSKPFWIREQQQSRIGNGCRLATDTNGSRLEVGQSIASDPRPQQSTTERTDWRTIEPTVRRGDHGISNRVDRLRCLGNAVVPDIAQFIGERIVECQRRKMKYEEENAIT